MSTTGPPPALDGELDRAAEEAERAARRKRWLALAVLCACLLVIGIDNTILNVALPALVRDLGATTTELQWIVDGYTLVFAGLLLTMGSLGDRFGRRGALAAGLVTFGVGSAASAMATSSTMLIATRSAMGVGAALIMPSTLSLLTTVFEDPKERARAIGIWAAVAGIGGVVGPVLGGFLVESFYWGAAFLVNIPVVVVALVSGAMLLPTYKDPDAGRLDPIGAVLSILGLVTVLWAVIEVPLRGWSDPVVVAALVTGIAVLGAFVVWELRIDHPMFQMQFFANPRFSVASAAITLVFFSMFGAVFLITQYLQGVLGFDPFDVGLRIMPLAGVMLFVAPLAPRLVERVGTKLVVGSGLLLAAGGFLLALGLPVSDGYPRLFVALVVIAVGMGLFMAPATESIMGSLPRAKAGVGSAMNQTTRQAGTALGVAVVGSVFLGAYRSGVDAAGGALGVPEELAPALRESVFRGLEVANELPEPVGALVADLVRAEFMRGFNLALIVGAVVVGIAATLVFAYLPSKGRDEVEA